MATLSLLLRYGPRLAAAEHQGLGHPCKGHVGRTGSLFVAVPHEITEDWGGGGEGGEGGGD